MARNSYVLNATSLSKNRSSWTQSKSHKTSIPFGKVVPLGAPIEILPGDTFKLDMAGIIRMLTPKAPLMDSITGDVYAYFVPNRLVFDKSKEFFGQNESQAWTLNLSYTIPHFSFRLSQADYVQNGTTGNYYLSITRDSTVYDARGTLFDHFELPFVYLTGAQKNTLPAEAPSASNLTINLLPFRGYQIIWNEDFRNPAVVDPALTLNYDHSDVSGLLNYFNAFRLKPVMRYRDLFSSSLKAPQRGPSATIPLGSLAPIVGINGSSQLTANEGVLAFSGIDRTAGAKNNLATYGIAKSSSVTTEEGESFLDTIGSMAIYADLSSASAATVNTLRQSIAIQHLHEMMTNAFRYNEYTEVFFGVRGSDAILQRPQHLGGLHFRINVNQVLSTAEGSNTTVGSTGAFGVGELKGHIYTNSFTEHGYVYLLLVLRKEHTYVQGLDKMWRKREFLDIYQPPLAHIGNVDIKQSEIWLGFADSGKSVDDTAFGYTEPYYEYRYMVSKACGLMNPIAPGSLSYYSLTDVLSGKPSLNETFVSEDPNGLDNALFASANNVDQFYGDFFMRYYCSRVMPLYSVPGLNRI